MRGNSTSSVDVIRITRALRSRKKLFSNAVDSRSEKVNIINFKKNIQVNLRVNSMHKVHVVAKKCRKEK